jgi:hypothetical protein
MAGQTPNTILPVRRNTSNQIISYTLPNDSINEYGYVRKMDTRSVFNSADFKTVVAKAPTTLVYPNPPSSISIITMPSLIWPVPSDEVLFIAKYKWTGELVRIGTLPSSISDFFYIEDGIYHKMEGNGILNLIAEKLGKPLWFRIGNLYHDSTSTIDFGQNQFSIYDKQTYKRSTSAYVDSFFEGDVITPIDIMVPGLFSREIRINNQLSDAVFTPPIYGDVIHSGVRGVTSTRASWFNDKADNERDIITSIGDVITIQFNTKPGLWEYKMQLQYDGGPDVLVNVRDTSQIHTVLTTTETEHMYDIPAYLITDKLKQINIILAIPGYIGQTIVGTPTGNI